MQQYGMLTIKNLGGVIMFKRLIKWYNKWYGMLSDLECKTDIYNNPNNWIVINGKWLPKRS